MFIHSVKENLEKNIGIEGNTGKENLKTNLKKELKLGMWPNEEMHNSFESKSPGFCNESPLGFVTKWFCNKIKCLLFFNNGMVGRYKWIRHDY